MNEATSTSLAAGDILPRRTPYPTWPGSLALLAAIVLYLGILISWNNATPSGPLVAPGATVEVGRGVSYVPVTGWSLDAPVTKPGESHGVRLGTASFSIAATEWKGSVRGPVERAQRLAQVSKDARHVGKESPFTTLNGLNGTVVDVFGENSHGRLWVVVDAAQSRAIVMHADATPDQFHRHEPAMQAMVDSVVLGAAP
jgi:hypothetical protein